MDNLNKNSFSLLTFNNSHLIVLDPFEINPFSQEIPLFYPDEYFGILV
jgi:hypothetical protein